MKNRIYLYIIFLVAFAPYFLFAQLENYVKYMPSSSSGEIINHSFYSLSYLEDHEIPEWTIYFSTKARLEGEGFPRTSDFRPDPKIKDGSAQLIDYKGSGYDRGHSVPAADMVFSKIAISEAFYLSNIAPQKAGFNRGIWKRLEDFIRSELTPKYDSLIIVTGCLLQDSSNFDQPKTQIGNVSVPFFYYKVIIDVKRKSSIAFIISNKTEPIPNNSNGFLKYICSIKDLERLTGIDFFYKLSEKEELDFEDGINN
tara:strand:+ start:54 stop:818 length:765 start_codon:yes stop_codon:yes gene_type:complete